MQLAARRVERRGEHEYRAANFPLRRPVLDAQPLERRRHVLRSVADVAQRVEELHEARRVPRVAALAGVHGVRAEALPARLEPIELVEPRL